MLISRDIFNRFLINWYIKMKFNQVNDQMINLMTKCRSIFRNSKIANIKITIYELFDMFIFEFSFSFF